MPNGFIVPIAVALPNILFMIFPPTSMPSANTDTKCHFHTLMEVMEKIGQIGSFALPFFYRFHLQRTWDLIGLSVMIACLGFYYLGWARYFSKGRQFALLYNPMLGIPLPMAISPVLCFLAASIILHSPYLAGTAIVLGVGHIYISSLEHKRCLATPSNNDSTE